MLLANARVVTPDGVLEPGWVRVSGDRIAEVGAGDAAEPDQDLGGAWLVPGFVDLHTHGGGGASFQSGDPVAVGTAAAFHHGRGTTTLLASLVTAGVDDLVLALHRLREHGDVLAGAHLEGPFLARSRCGAHDPALLRPPEPADVARLLATGAVAMMTLAPELPGGIDAIRRTVEAGARAAVGHTAASYSLTRAAVDAGATVATHLFNGMPPLLHRDPGPVGALLEDDRVTLELIVDGRHVHPSVVRMVLAAAPGRVAFVSDAIEAAGCPDGVYEIGGRPVVVRAGTAELSGADAAIATSAADKSVGTGVLAGSTVTVAEEVRRAVRAGLAMVDAVAAGSIVPARALGLDHRVGSIEAGKDADLVVLDEDAEVRAVLRKGEWVTPR